MVNSTPTTPPSTTCVTRHKPKSINDAPSAGIDSTIPSRTAVNIGNIPHLSPFALSFLALPPELLTHILLYLAPDDLGILSRVVGPLEGVERDSYLWAVWVHSTAPSRVGHALFSPIRPDALELVRRGTLRGMAIINGVRAGTYWGSPAAVRLSAIHDTLTRRSLRRHLSHALCMRPSRPALVRAGILPGVPRGASSNISARAYNLERARARDAARQALRAGGLKSFVEKVGLGIWKDSQRVLLALCPSIRERQRFFEGLARV
ncbi:hypothetical protein CcaverHIS002_0106110 [Cutaneotrichosporon cavernicola]|uniref:F-box domain-containing protein n=1 Tax=Cutaneotrichosporon cavernicola TaxID=279322 RepID=A0AA48I810_9TREE|nr:uncharacterized protein CcaverHIS019_0106050 [Cutaneotrichosporon cavernicola]BEI80082.1 hypothetical protein CcaverHIS002_0106110 [Cutaneotrichosporon cavernicola]BEI87887.1 hypothetical protein CcaverHIS019_0106050 [Cutaneotrichosporon cavernicola]BEI95661.1 hypothetical protein CcaverHIS631_0106100 [Cutaneotrichosporon cavernicola]BEJ03435.1 hypothetical protein CcaverHIS641_0106100 [Cutaneotrichosporon cavernicola]